MCIHPGVSSIHFDCDDYSASVSTISFQPLTSSVSRWREGMTVTQCSHVLCLVTCFDTVLGRL